MPHLETDQFVAAQPAGNQESQKSPVAQAEAGFGIGHSEQFARFSLGQPFPEPLSPLLHIRHRGQPQGLFGRERAPLGRLAKEQPDGTQPLIDRRHREAAGEQGPAPGFDQRFR